MSQAKYVTRAIRRFGLLATPAAAWLLATCVSFAVAQERHDQIVASDPTELKLPPLDAIDAETSLAVFLQKGVPPHITVAALRRAWTADPRIRDFKGLAELDWDMSTGDGVFGFGELGPEVDIPLMLASLFSEPDRAPVHVAQRSDGFASLLFSLGYAREAAHE